jgi:hypothetical protein
MYCHPELVEGCAAFVSRHASLNGYTGFSFFLDTVIYLLIYLGQLFLCLQSLGVTWHFFHDITEVR